MATIIIDTILIFFCLVVVASAVGYFCEGGEPDIIPETAEDE